MQTTFEKESYTVGERGRNQYRRNGETAQIKSDTPNVSAEMYVIFEML